ncbi:hypothetical protein ACFTUC_38825 [Streptomyces sp. NPDC056944]|uniref:hypothetical protein n=1 Tax=unclassified Streptomyces TaxID=2593676 RepID=UPI00363BF860
MNLSQELYDQWRAEIQYWRKDGKADRSKIRRDLPAVLLSVRSLYIDLHSWAITEPERWAQWVTPCPIMPRDLKGFSKRLRDVNRRMADRTRVRQPLLPVLVRHIEDRYERLADLAYLALLWCFERTLIGRHSLTKQQNWNDTASAVAFLDDLLAWHLKCWVERWPTIRAALKAPGRVPDLRDHDSLSSFCTLVDDVTGPKSTQRSCAPSSAKRAGHSASLNDHSPRRSAASLAHEHGLICLDPQEECLLP